jgi:hypothetical protein
MDQDVFGFGKVALRTHVLYLLSEWVASVYYQNCGSNALSVNLQGEIRTYSNHFYYKWDENINNSIKLTI